MPKRRVSNNRKLSNRSMNRRWRCLDFSTNTLDITPYAGYPAMPPMKDQNMKSKTSETEVVEVISPLDLHAARTADTGSSQRWAMPAVLIFLVLALTVTGAWLIWYLSNNPVSYPQEANKATRPQPAAPAIATTAAETIKEQTAAVPVAPEVSENAASNRYSKELLELMATGSDHESRKEFSQAQAAYQKAHTLDQSYKEAGIALQRVTDRITDQRYQQALSEGLKAFAKTEYVGAKRSLLQAISLKPDAREAQNALARVDKAMLDSRINGLKQSGQAAEQAENWRVAGEHYGSILELDPGNDFARQGKERALGNDRIFSEMQFLLNHPDVLTTGQNLEKATALALEAQSIEPKGTQFTQALQQLEQMVVEARKPVRLTITSDNRTQVDVYRVGKLGQFSQKDLDLKPGVYTVIGYREGYQDIRQQIVIRPGQQNLRVTIICKVKV